MEIDAASYPLLAAMALSLVLLHLNQRLASPKLAVINRWLRWLIFASGLAYLLRRFELVERPFWVLACAGFLLWFLMETIYNWLAISAMSLSPVPLFPVYQPNPGGDEWPMQPRVLKMRDWLRSKGWKVVQALRADVGGGIYLRMSVYENGDGFTRLHLLFIPQTNGTVSPSWMFLSLEAQGQRVLTDNLAVPFGGFYPENWDLVRRPWTRNLVSLAKLHAKRCEGRQLIKPNYEPLSDLERSQRELDFYNTEMGFLHQKAEREEHGKITHEGRYRLWREIWMLDYLGFGFKP